MQQISIALVVALFFCLPAKTLMAANEVIVTTPKAISHLLSTTVGATIQVNKTTIPAPNLKMPDIEAANPPLTSTATITRLKPITVQVTTMTPPGKPAAATPTAKVTTTVPVTPTAVAPTATPDAAAEDAAYAKTITGTIIANRTEAKIRFFVEGATYELAAVRSIGLNLPRATAVLNLYNCDANTPESKDCFWDPYLLDKDSFYEIVNGADAGKTVNLSLRQAGTPPADKIWVQNRTDKRETVFYNNQVHELPPSSVEEFTAEANSPTILLHLRSCITIGDKSACEWSPRNIQPGSYYALVEVDTQGQKPNSSIRNLELQSVIAPAGKTAPASQAPAPMTCRLQVPVINIRSGPGLQYQVIGKVVGSEQEPASVVVIGRDDTQQWLAVEDKVAPGGWMTASPGFLQCSADIATLPIAKVTDGRLEPTPAPAIAAVPQGNSDTGPTNTGTTNTGSGQTSAGAQTTQTVTNTTPAAPTAPSVGPGQALIVVNNGFDQPIRFTLDQIYRLEQGPSEFDLQPGQGINILVHPGQIAFSASSAWHSLAGNAEFFLDDQKSRVMWITFVPDPDGSGKWILQF